MKVFAKIIALLCVAGALSGCSTTNTVQEQLDINGPHPGTSPLDEFRTLIVGTSWANAWDNETLSYASRHELFNEFAVQMEDLIAQCMHDAGFEYVPAPDIHVFTLPSDVGWNPDGRDWVGQYGYGLWDYNLRQPGQGEGLAASFSTAHGTLSENELAAWRRAFYGRFEELVNAFHEGRIPEYTISEIRADPTPESLGCRDWGRLEAELSVGNLNSGLLEEFRPLFSAFDELLTQLDEETSEADRNWAWCMADAGHPDLERQPDAEWAAGIERMNFGSWDGTESDQVRQLREQEIELALADFDCRVATNFEARQAERRIAAETQFVNDHRSELEALRAAVEQQ